MIKSMIKWIYGLLAFKFCFRTLEWNVPKHVAYMCNYMSMVKNKYTGSLNNKLCLRLATIYGWCLSNKPLHISKANTKVSSGGFPARVQAVGFIPILGWNTVKRPYNQSSFIHLYLAMHSATLWYYIHVCSISHDRSRHLCEQRSWPICQ